MSREREILKEYFGHDSFREGQEDIINNIMEGKDVLAVMPTGAGKSICYQIPALMSQGITIVISPLISLMKDQVTSLIQMGIPAAFLNSSLTYNQINKAIAYAKTGKYKIIYVAPERLTSREFLDFARNTRISIVAIDEAHCVSQWGQDFRPSYLKISEFINELDYRPVLSAFTATATSEVKEDIRNLLNLDSPFEITTGFDRPNLYFSVIKPSDKNATLVSLVKERKDKSGIIYCSTRRAVEEVSEMLDYKNYSVTKYHAGLELQERKQNQEDFLYDRKQIMVATNAFGMGIDKSNVSYVIHYNLPKDIESYYQEAGRAGRDGEKAECILLYTPKDIRTIKYFIENPDENSELTEDEIKVLQEKELEKLKYMTYYCTTSDCLRQFILKYFGDKSSNYCGNCSNCLANFETANVTNPAKNILKCILTSGQRFGKTMIVDILRGADSQKINSFNLKGNPFYDTLSKYSKNGVYDIIDKLEELGYIVYTDSQFPSIKITQKGYSFINNDEELTMKIIRKEMKSASKDKASDNGVIEPELLSKLKLLRKTLAAKASVPAFVIFSDATLYDMCRKLPITDGEFLEVSGVGKVKCEKYGEEFISVIKEHCQNKTTEITHEQVKEQVRKNALGYEKWTTEEDDRLKSEYESGMTIKEIAAEHKRSMGAIRSRLLKDKIIYQ